MKLTFKIPPNLPKLNHKNQVVLETLWWGVSVGGEHYIGTLTSEDDKGYKRVELQHPLTSKEAQKLNIKERCGAYHRYKEGDLSERFCSLEDLIKSAKEQWRTLFPGAIILIHGQSAVAEMQPVIDGHPELMKLINEMNDAAEAVGRWDTDASSKKMQKIWD